MGGGHLRESPARTSTPTMPHMPLMTHRVLCSETTSVSYSRPWRSRLDARDPCKDHHRCRGGRDTASRLGVIAGSAMEAAAVPLPQLLGGHKKRRGFHGRAQKYRYPVPRSIASAMHSGLRALVLLCIRVHGTRRSMAGLSGYPVPRSMVGYAYGYQWRVSAMRGTRYPCQWQTMIVAGWHVPPLGGFSSSPAANEKMLR